jgi:hypothetical protein
MAATEHSGSKEAATPQTAESRPFGVKDLAEPNPESIPI